MSGAGSALACGVLSVSKMSRSHLLLALAALTIDTIHLRCPSPNLSIEHHSAAKVIIEYLQA